MSDVSKNELLQKIRQYNFAAYDMLLYLDTHPSDKKAFNLYRELVRTYNDLKEKYQKQYGPLDPYAAAESDTFDWLDSPWPWEKQREDV